MTVCGVRLVYERVGVCTATVHQLCRWAAIREYRLTGTMCGSGGRRHRRGDLADEVASESVDQPLKLGLLVRVPAVEELAEARAFRGDEPFVVVSAACRERDRAVVSAVDEGALPEVLECLADRGPPVLLQLLCQLRLGQRRTLAQSREQPQLRRREVDACAGGEAFVQIPSLFTPGEQR
jgi:hypothetical protein